MKNILSFLILFLSLTVMANAQSLKKDKNVLKVYVSTKGDIIIDNKNVTFQKLEREIKRIRRKKGVIYYSTVLDNKVSKKANTKVTRLIGK